MACRATPAVGFYVIFQTRVGVLPPTSKYREASLKTRRSQDFLTSFEVF